MSDKFLELKTRAEKSRADYHGLVNRLARGIEETSDDGAVVDIPDADILDTLRWASKTVDDLLTDAERIKRLVGPSANRARLPSINYEPGEE